jgi:hypothetical protein
MPRRKKYPKYLYDSNMKARGKIDVVDERGNVVGELKYKPKKKKKP